MAANSKVRNSPHSRTSPLLPIVFKYKELSAFGRESEDRQEQALGNKTSLKK